MGYDPFANVGKAAPAATVTYDPFSNVKKAPPINRGQQTLNAVAGQSTNLIGKALTGDLVEDFLKGGVGKVMEPSKTGQAVGEGILGAGNSALFGIPKFGLGLLAKKNNLKLPEPKSPMAENIGGMAGLLAGPGLLAAKATRMIKPLVGRGVVKSVGRGTIEGAGTGLLAAPQKREDFLDPKQRGINAVVGAGVGAAGELALSGAKNVGMVATQKGRSELVDRTRDAFRAKKKAAGDQFESVINDLTAKNPNTYVDLETTVDQLIKDIELNPKLASAVNRTPELKALLNAPQGTRQMRLADSQNLKNMLQSRISKAKLDGRGIRPDDIDLLDTVDDIRNAQLSAFPDANFPQYAGARKQYGDVIGDYGLVRNKIREGGTEKQIYNKFGGDIETEKAVSRLLPKENQREVAAARFTKNVIEKGPARLGLLGGGTFVLKKLFDALRGRQP